MKINFTTYFNSRAGGTRVIFEVANRLAGRGHEVTITSLGQPKHQWFPLNNVKTIYPELSNGRLLIRSMGELFFKKTHFSYEIDPVRFLCQSTPDVDINVATFCLTAFPVYRSGKGVPFYYIQHYEPLFFREDPYSYKMVEETYMLPIEWIVNSTWVKNVLKEKFGRDGTLIIPGVDSNIFYPRDFQKNDDVKVILSLGKNSWIKGLNNLFAALNLVHKKIPNIKLVMYGSEPFLKQSAPVPCVYVNKPSDAELAKLYSMADVVITPSVYESSPLPLLEAMACGAPVVTTRYGTEDYAFHEKNCLVVPPRDSKSLADATLRLLSDGTLQDSFKKEGLKIAKQFTWEKTADNVEKLFDRALR